MSAYIGAVLCLSGAFAAQRTYTKGVDAPRGLNFDGLDLQEKIMKLAAYTLKLVGSFAHSIGTILAGATLWGAAPSAGFVALFHQVVTQSAGWYFAGFASYAAGISLGEIVQDIQFQRR